MSSAPLRQRVAEARKTPGPPPRCSSRWGAHLPPPGSALSPLCSAEKRCPQVPTHAAIGTPQQRFCVPPPQLLLVAGLLWAAGQGDSTQGSRHRGSYSQGRPGPPAPGLSDHAGLALGQGHWGWETLLKEQTPPSKIQREALAGNHEGDMEPRVFNLPRVKQNQKETETAGLDGKSLSSSTTRKRHARGGAPGGGGRSRVAQPGLTRGGQSRSAAHSGPDLGKGRRWTGRRHRRAG